MVPMFDESAHRVVARRSPRKIAVLSIDLEYDYGGDRADALDRLPELLAVVKRSGAPLTAFVEGRLFVRRPDLCNLLLEAEADVQLHCWSHKDGPDTAESLRRSAAAFERFTGARPRGYRAATYRLTEEIFQALVTEGFAWDSSILPGIGIGNHSGKAFRKGDFFVLDDALMEFPVSSWRRLGIPFTQSYRQMMGPLAESALLRTLSLPKLLVYDMHMTDLVPDGRIWGSPLPLWIKGGQALVRRRKHGLNNLAALLERMRAQGYEWTTLSNCHELTLKWAPPAGSAMTSNPSAAKGRPRRPRSRSTAKTTLAPARFQKG